MHIKILQDIYQSIKDILNIIKGYDDKKFKWIELRPRYNSPNYIFNIRNVSDGHAIGTIRLQSIWVKDVGYTYKLNINDPKVSPIFQKSLKTLDNWDRHYKFILTSSQVKYILKKELQNEGKSNFTQIPNKSKIWIELLFVDNNYIRSRDNYSTIKDTISNTNRDDPGKHAKAISIGIPIKNKLNKYQEYNIHI